MRLCLNLGCGAKPTPSSDSEKWVNVDVRPLPGVEVVHDLRDRNGLPFEPDSVDHVFLDNVLEHLPSADAIFLLNELGRVLKVGGTAEIIVPHAHSQGAWQDPTHVSAWVPRSVIYWSQKRSPYGGRAVGITANLVEVKTEVYGKMETEAFIRFRVRKDPE